MMFFVYTHILNQHHNFVNSFIYKLPIICIFIQIDTAKFVADKQKKPQTKRLRLREHSGRGRRIRTLGTRFWRPLLYQLSYTPILISTDEIMKVSFVNLLINFNARLIISPFSRFVNTFLWNLTFWAERWFFQYLQYKCSDQITQFLWFPADFRGSLQFGNGVRRWGIQGTACRCWGCPE